MNTPSNLLNGHSNVGDLIETSVERYKLVNIKRKRARIGVVCSGSDDMNRAVRSTCSKMQARGVDVGVEVEKFGW